jgi:ribose-phosphate pyrophosphokinase
MIYLNGDPVNVTLFPDNTSQVWKLNEGHLSQERATILWEYSHEGEIMHLVQLKNLLDVYGVDRVYLHLEYLPYGRQDKSYNNNATFALRSFAQILNSLRFSEVFIMDPHSIVALGLIKKSTAVYPHGPLKRALESTGADLVCYPDLGAVGKYSVVYKNTPDYIYGKKTRNQDTGYISNYELVGDCEDKIVLIVDDICDGGKTFEILAADLFAGGAENVHLFVTHGLFTKGLRPLRKAGIEQIHTNKGLVVTMPDGGFGFRKIDN